MNNIKILIMFTVLTVFTGCATGFYYKANGSLVKHCRYTPVPFIISKDVPKSHRAAIKRSFLYWNEVLGRKVYFSMGELDYASNEPAIFGLVIINASYRDGGYAETLLKWNKKSCIKSARIFIKPHSFNKDINVFETIMRHEAGHALGIRHSDIFTDLMWHKLEKTQQHPVDASDREIEVIRFLYK